jgi:hypothetical protein
VTREREKIYKKKKEHQKGVIGEQETTSRGKKGVIGEQETTSRGKKGVIREQKTAS